MPLDWLDVTPIPINVLLLLEREQLSWLPGWIPEKELGVVFKNHPHIAWYFAHKNPDIKQWVETVIQTSTQSSPLSTVFEAERTILNAMQDLIIYVWDPQIYDKLQFLNWDKQILLDLVDFSNKVVVDIGSGTGKQVFIALAAGAKHVYSIEPVENLRHYVSKKALTLGYQNLYCLNGLLTKIPLPDETADIVMQGHVFGDYPVLEIREMERVTKPGGMVIHIPGNNDVDNEAHRILLEHGYQWDRFEEPGDGIKRKYWKVI